MRVIGSDIVLGQVYVSKRCGKFKIVKIENAKAITVRFLKTKYRKQTDCFRIRTGDVPDPFFPKVRGKGFMGEGLYNFANSARIYYIWSAILARCYDPATQAKQPTYKGCTVVKRWHNFQSFCTDIVKMSNWNVEGFELDKDLRVPGNKKYGPKYCCFIPKIINILMSPTKLHGEGVDERDNGRFRAKINKYGKQVTLGTFDSRKIAVKVQAEAKRAYIRELAKEHRKNLHKDVYRTLLAFG